MGWPAAAACLLACWFGEESQQPMAPHVWHSRRWTQRSPVLRHSAQPATGSVGSRNSIWSRCVQVAMPPILRPSEPELVEPQPAVEADSLPGHVGGLIGAQERDEVGDLRRLPQDRKSTRLNSSHTV